MIKKIKINTISFYDKDAKGAALITKTGKPFRRAQIQIDEYGLEKITGPIWDDKSPINFWKQGQEVLANIYTEPYNGKDWLKFEVPKKEDLMQSEIEDLKKRVSSLEKQLDGAEVVGEPIDEPPVEEIDPSSLPF